MDIFGIDKSKRIEVITAGPRNVIIEYFDRNKYRFVSCRLTNIISFQNRVVILKETAWFRIGWFLSYLNFWAEMIKWKRKKYRTSDGSYDRMLKKKWDAALETGLESGIFKHDHKGWF